MNSMVTNRTENNKDWFDFDKMIKFLKEWSHDDKEFIDFLYEMQDVRENGHIVKRTERFVDTVNKVKELMYDCLYYECSNMWVRHSDKEDFDGKWYDDFRNYIHFGISGDFVTGDEIKFYYKVTHTEEIPFSGKEVKYYLGCANMMLQNYPKIPLNPFEQTINNRIRRDINFKCLRVLDSMSDILNLYDKEKGGIRYSTICDEGED